MLSRFCIKSSPAVVAPFPFACSPGGGPKSTSSRSQLGNMKPRLVPNPPAPSSALWWPPAVLGREWKVSPRLANDVGVEPVGPEEGSYDGCSSLGSWAARSARDGPGEAEAKSNVCGKPDEDEMDEVGEPCGMADAAPFWIDANAFVAGWLGGCDEASHCVMSASSTPALVCAVVHVVPISFRLATISRRSFLACERRSESCFGLFERLSSAAEMARTVPALNAALTGQSL
jgi:hypothetical protein